MCAGRGILVLSVLSAQFCCEIKTDLKVKFIDFFKKSFKKNGCGFNEPELDHANISNQIGILLTLSM